jgi:hypothetical protein
VAPWPGSSARRLLGSRQRADLGALAAEAVAALHAAGFGTEAEQLLAASRTPTTSSLEITGEIGIAILRVQAGVGHLLPREAKRALERCLREIRRSWPELALE